MAHVCPWWLIRSFDNPLRRLFHDAEAILGDLVSPGDRCLDLGCGYGYFAVPMARLVSPGGSVTAADVQRRMLDGVRRRAEKAGVASLVGLHLVDPGPLRLPGPYDFVLAFWVVHETPDPEGTVREVRRALAPGGRFLLVEPKVHVREGTFRRLAARAEAEGLVRLPAPSVAVSRAALFALPPGRAGEGAR